MKYASEMGKSGYAQYLQRIARDFIADRDAV